MLGTVPITVHPAAARKDEVAATRRDAVGRANRGLFPEASISIMRAKPEGWTEFARVEASGAEQIIEERR